MIDQLCKEITVADLPDEQSLKTWLQQQASNYELQYLLAHADDGVIWGKFDNGTLAIAKDAFAQFPQLHPITLQQCRAFGGKAEVLLWRTGNSWKSRVIDIRQGIELINEYPIITGIFKQFRITDTDLLIELIEEKLFLWGNQFKKDKGGINPLIKQGFSLLTDGQEGLEHAVPLTLDLAEIPKTNLKKKRLLYLVVHHYLDYNDAGVARIYLSRLVSFY